MLRSGFKVRMKSISFLLAFVAASATASDFFSPSSSLEYSCISSRNQCTLQNVVIESESDLDRVTFLSIANPLIIESGKIPNFTHKLAEKLAGIIHLVINRLQLVTLYVKPEMTHLEATYNQIDTLLVDDDPANTYDMVTLDLTGNKLADVEILSRFTKLRQLALTGNRLEKVSMDFFSGMTELRKLSLDNNQLFIVDTENSFHLLNLRSLSFAGNQLLDLNVEKWELDSLMELDLSNNKLYLLDGSLDQFKALVDVKISGNYWKCDILIGINRFERLKFDQDESDRCKKNELSDVKQVCCTDHASNFLNNSTAGGDLELFQDKWEQLRQLNDSFQQFKNATEQNHQRIEQLEEDEETTLVERIKQLETEQQKMWYKLNNLDESKAVEEVNEVKRVILDYKSTIEELESKQSDLRSELEGLIETLNSRYSINDKCETIDEVKEKVSELQNNAKCDEMNLEGKQFTDLRDTVKSLEGQQLQKNEKSDEMDLVVRKVSELRDTFKVFEGQQLKYYLSNVDLKNQIANERSRITEVEKHYSKLVEETGLLREQMGSAQKNNQIILNILEEMNSEEF